MSNNEATAKTEATAKKTEATAKKIEANEKGATSTVNYKDIRTNRITIIVLCIVAALIVLAGIVALILTFTRPPVPRFMLDDIYVDPASKSNVLVELSSTNPSSSSIYYSKMSIHMRIERIFESERVFLQNTLQKPHERSKWTAVVATNNVKNDKPDGSFQIRDGVKDGEVIADVKIKKIHWIFNLNNRFHVTCPVLLNLRNLTAAVSRPMSTCQIL